MFYEWFERVEGKINALNKKMNHLLKEVRHLSVDQATFNEHLQELTTAIDDLVNAVQAKLSSSPDFSEEDTALQAATQRVKDAMDTVNPNVDDPTPGDLLPGDVPPGSQAGPAVGDTGGDSPPVDETPAEEQPAE